MSHTGLSLIACGTACNPSMLTCQKKSLIRTCPPKSPSSPSSRSGSDSHRRGSDPFAPSSILTLEVPRLTLSMNGRSRSIRQDFRTCADIVCTLQDDDVDLWIQDEEFANTLWGLFHDMPDSWRRHLGLRDLPPRGKRLARSTGKGTKNRAIFNLRRNLPTKKLDVETIEAIWKWADDPACLDLPATLGESTWYHHCHAGGSDGHELVTLLEARGVMQDASEQRHNGRNAYGVVDQLFQGLLNRGGASFIPDGPIASSRGQGPLGKRVRGSRMSSRREPFSRVPSSPPTIEQQAVEDWPPQRPMDPSLAWCSDATSGCSAGDNSPLTVSSRDDNCHIWHVPSQPIV
ncbi:hypothetical protein N7513_003383 [Penicillium frequentans]|nr:hypothetical protein N7513_003383 [Penicillium glabrum]